MIDIPQLEDGEMVPDNGAFRCTMAHYHSQAICPGPSISSTDIRRALTKSPHAFWKSSNLNPDRYPEREPSDALVLGRAAHSLILGDEVFHDHFIYVPGNAPRKPTPQQIEAYKDGRGTETGKTSVEFWTEFEQRAAGREFLTEKQVETIQYMAENLAACPEAVVALTGQLTEVSMIWQDEQTGLWIKSRPDCIPADQYDFGDLKTYAVKGSDPLVSAFRSVTDNDYPMQMGLAQMGALEVFGTNPVKNCMLVFIQTTEPYEPVPIELDEETLAFARIRNRRGIDIIAHGLKTGEWPFRAETIARYTYPPSVIERFYTENAA